MLDVPLPSLEGSGVGHRPGGGLFLSNAPRSLIQRTPDTQSRLLHRMSVNLRRRHVFVPEQLLHCSNVIACFQQMRGETVPLRHHRHSVLKAFAIPHQDLAPLQAQVLHPQPYQVQQAQPAAIHQPHRQLVFLRVDRVLGELGIGKDDAAGRRRFAEATEERRGKDRPGEWRVVRRGWFLGSEQLKEQLLERMGTAMGNHHGGVEKQETDE